MFFDGIRSKSFKKTLQTMNTTKSYFCAQETLSHLIATSTANSRLVVAPMLPSTGLYRWYSGSIIIKTSILFFTLNHHSIQFSNFWAGMTDSYYYARAEEYRQILDRKKIGVHSVLSNMMGFPLLAIMELFFKIRINFDVESL